MQYFVYNFQAFLLIFIRLHSMMVTAPFFASAVIPFRLKTLLSFLITLIIFPMIMKGGYTVSGETGGYALQVLNEVIIGIIIGYLSSVVFAAFQLAGQFFAVQIGFGINEVVDPLAQVSIPIIGQLKNMMALLVFLYINGHHYLIQAIYRSYELAPIVSVSGKAGLGFLKIFGYSFSGMFVVALKIAIPIVATIFLVSVSMGVLAKAAPQMNIMMLGFPLKIIIAFALLAFLSPMIIRIIRVALERSLIFLSNTLVHWPGLLNVGN